MKIHWHELRLQPINLWSLKMGDNTNPSHYKQGAVECIDALEAATIRLTGIEAVCTANAIKYLWRHREKSGAEDLKKCLWYVNKLISIYDKERAEK